MSNDEKLPHKGKIIIASILIPAVVAALFGLPKVEGVNTSFLPMIYASINGLTAFILIAALVAVKKKKIELHQRLIKIAIGCSILFLAGYVTYHLTSHEARYGDVNGDGVVDVQEAIDAGSIRFVYLILLLTHILFSIGVIPLVLLTFVRGNAGHVKKHRKLAKTTFPVWLYVAITGVVVYLFIAPYQESRRVYVEQQNVATTVDSSSANE